VSRFSPRQTAQRIIDGYVPDRAEIVALARSYIEIIDHISTTSEAFTQLETNLKDLELYLHREVRKPVPE
jgi:hypothetical protein